MLPGFARWTLALAFTTAVFGVAGCGGGDLGGGGGVQGSENTLVSRLPAEMEHLNPFTARDAASSSIDRFIFESLIELDNATLEMKPKLAESWDVSDDQLTFTFKLRQNVTFSDGEPMTAHDVKFSFDKLMDPSVDAPHLRGYYQDVGSCELIDDYTVQFVANRRYFRLLFMLGGLQVIPEHIYGEGDFNVHPNNRNPIGTGPYVLTRWDTGQSLLLTRNENYWGDLPPIERRLYLIITDTSAAFQVLRRGEMDVMTLTPEQWTTQADTPDFEAQFNKFEFPAPAYTYIGWNMRRPFFEDKRVRQALTMLTPRQLILDEIYYGLAEITTGSFFVNEPEYDKTVEPWPYDPARARKQLEEAGWVDHDGDGVLDKDGTPFRFELLMRTKSDNGEKTATILQEELRRVGIEMNIRTLEWATFLQNIEKQQFDATMLAWSLPPFPDPYQVWHSSQAAVGGSNSVGFINEAADKIIDEARTVFDRDERVKLYHRFHEIVHEEQPYTFLFAPYELLTVDKRVENVTIYPYGPDSLEWRLSPE